jgi:hypothetical protein
MNMVYMHKCVVDGKVYIGYTQHQDDEFILRCGHNGSRYLRHPLFGPAIEEYGWHNFKHIVLKRDLTRKEATYWMKYYIRQYKADNPEFGYNLPYSANSKNNGRIIIHKNLKNKYINKEELQDYLNKGWKKGGWTTKELENQ